MDTRDIIIQKNKFNHIIDIITTVVAITMGIYHFVSAKQLYVTSDVHTLIHMTFALVLVFLQKTKFDGKSHKAMNTLLSILSVLSILVAVFISINYVSFKTSMGQNVPGKVEIGLILLVLMLIGTYLTWGKIIPVIVCIALLYGYAGPNLPGILYHGGLSIQRLITYSTTNFTGIFGMLGVISANTIVLFSVFAGMMQSFGALDAIMDVAMSASGRFRSGAAQVAVISSGLIGSVTGSVAANIAMTGTVSIPLMKKRGYPNEFAAACEAAASTGGAILPPVMNAAAFIIASWTNTPYIKVALMGFAPAILYYIGISLSVYIKAVKIGDERNTDDSLPKFKDSFKNFIVFVIPLVVLIIFMAMMYSPQISLFYAIITLLIIGLLKELKLSQPLDALKMYIHKLLSGFETGAKSMAMIAVVMGIMGVVVEILTATGLPSKISQYVIVLAGNNLFLLSLFVAITCIVFGMGMPAAPAYILAALLGAPALTSFGVPLLAAHFFVFYLGEMSAITPPVAIGCLVASGMANSNFLKTCLITLRLAICGFTIPFLFIFRPAILLMGTPLEFIWSVIMVIVFIISFVIVSENFLAEPLKIYERIGAALAAFFAIYPHKIFDWVGLVLLVAILISHFYRHSKNKNKGSAVVV